MELGIASDTIGLIAACVVSDPIAAFLAARDGLVTSRNSDLDLGTVHETATLLDYFGVLWAILLLNITVTAGMGLHALTERTGLLLPAFVSCLMAGIVLRNLGLANLGDRGRATLRDVGQGPTLAD